MLFNALGKTMGALRDAASPMPLKYIPLSLAIRSMKANKYNKYPINFWVSETEWKLLEAEMQRTTARNLSMFVRSKILAAPLTYKYRNASLDDLTEQLAQLKEELKTVSYHFYTAVQKLDAARGAPVNAHWMISFEIDRRRVLKQIETINGYIHKLSGHDWDHQ